MRLAPPSSSWRRIALALVAVAALLWLTSAGLVLWFASRDGAVPADAIVVMGAAQYRGRPSPVLRSRLDHAVALYARGIAPRMVLTGGIAEGDVQSEAAVSRAYVLRQGVPDTALLQENEGRTTHESLRHVAQLLEVRGLERVVIVSDGFHLFRSWTAARHHGLRARTSPARPGDPLLSRLARQPMYFLSESVKAPLALFVEW